MRRVPRRSRQPPYSTSASASADAADARAAAERNRRERELQRQRTGAPVELISNYMKANILPVPASLGVDPFYAKYVDAHGIPVISSDKVPDDAIKAAGLRFADGTTQKFDGLTVKTGTFLGTGSHSGKVIVGAWIKSGSNFSQISGAPSGAGTWHSNG